ncbi:MAG: hypothetical protein Q4B96_05250 [Bacillota bacterium]|nr:hypothetical protein [Bacillota bacterium]
MSRYLRTYRDFSGGLSEAANDNMRDNQLLRAKNVMPGDGYGIARAYGTEIAYPQVAAGEPVCELIEFKPANSGSVLVAFTQAAADSQRIYLYDGEEQQWENICAATAPLKDWFIQAGKLWWLDGAAIWTYDGSSISEAAITPAAATPSAAELAFWERVKQADSVEQRGQRWFYASSVANELYFSDIGDPTSFELTSIININTKDDDTITALKEFNEGILIFKRRSVHYLSGWDLAAGTDIKLTQLNVTCGTAFPRSVKTVENAVLYLGINGIYRLYLPSYSYVVAAENISEYKISSALTEPGHISEAHAAVWDNAYYLTVVNQQPQYTDGVLDGYTPLRREFRYLPAYQAFFGEFTQGAHCYTTALGESGLFLGADNGYILRYDKSSYHYIHTGEPLYDADGELLLASGAPLPIEVTAVSKGFDVAGSMVTDAKLKKAQVVVRQYRAESSMLSLYISADYHHSGWEMDFDESLVWDEGEYGEDYWGWKDTLVKEICINNKAKRLQFTFTDAHLDMPLLIYGVGIIYKKKRPRGSREGVSEKAVVYND